MITALDLRQIRCADCTMLFAMTEDFRKVRLEDGRTFYCPAGHHNYYPKHREDMGALKKENQILSNRVVWAESEAEDAKRQKTALKGQLTKTRNRIANGVCPCCNRSFANVGRHMTNQHPDFKEAVT